MNNNISENINHTITNCTDELSLNEILSKVISNIKTNSDSDELKILIIDIKKNSPEFIHNETDIIKTLNCLIEEMNRRFNIIRNNECRNIFEYNSKAKADDKLPVYLLVINNFQSIVLNDSINTNKIENDIILLGQKSRSTGIYMLLSYNKIKMFDYNKDTNHYDIDFDNDLSGLIKAHFPNKIFKVQTNKSDESYVDVNGFVIDFKK